MKIKHDSASGKTSIHLNWTETRQFISSTSARQFVGTEVELLIQKCNDRLNAIEALSKPSSN
jgi:hypothetical protein